MKQFVDAVRQAVSEGNWFGALFMALALPDICGSIETPEAKSKERYTRWFKQYLGRKYPSEYFSPEDCYYLRCACLHQGIGKDQGNKTSFEGAIHFITPRRNVIVHLNKQGNALQMQVDIFCNDICEAVEEWLAGAQKDQAMSDRLKTLLNIHEHRDGKISWNSQ